MYEICRVDKEVLKIVGDGRYGNTVFTTFEWVSFLEKNQNAEPVVLELKRKNETCGYFVGLIIKKFGIKIMGSPFEGWLTPDMGFIRISVLDDSNALEDVSKYCFNKLGCMYIQITDKSIEEKDLLPGIKHFLSKSLYKDISMEKEEIYNSFTKSARKRIRQFNNRGAIIKQVNFNHDFVNTLYSQLEDVFAKQGLAPNYDVTKLHDMVDAFKGNEDRILAIQVFSEDNKCIASSIFMGMGEWCYSLVTGSYREGQHYLPNEKVRWFGIEYWKDKGATKFDFVGYREYKMKFSPEVVNQTTVYFSRYRILPYMKNIAKKIIVMYRKIRGIKHEGINN